MASSSTATIRMFDACREGDEKIALTLIKRDSSCLYEINHKEQIPLHEACRHGHLNIVRILLSSPTSNILKSDYDTNIPIHYACESGNADLVEYLLLRQQQDQQVASKNRFGQLPLHLAARCGYADIVSVLLKHDNRKLNGLRQTDRSGRLPLHHACYSGSLEAVQRVLHGFKKGAFQIKDRNGMLPLHHACLSSNKCNNNLELIEFLVDQNPMAVNIRTKTIPNQLPLDIAIEHGQCQEVVDYLSARTTVDEEEPVVVMGLVEVGEQGIIHAAIVDPADAVEKENEELVEVFDSICSSDSTPLIVCKDPPSTKYAIACRRQIQQYCCLPLHHNHLYEKKTLEKGSAHCRANKIRLAFLALLLVYLWIYYYWLRS